MCIFDNGVACSTFVLILKIIELLNFYIMTEKEINGRKYGVSDIQVSEQTAQWIKFRKKS